ncbi:VOC family protein [Weissella confusa]|uniref:VOC family protein n=1 Tax=Weissella confusa TaxID=1583 RepID=UPI00376ECF7F
MADVTYKITHLTVQGANKQAMRLFYRDILGLIEHEVAENEFSYAFTAGEAPFLNIVFGGKTTVERRGGLYHFAILLPDAGSLATLIDRLIRLQYPMGAGDHDVSEAFYLNDPDGNGIELYHDRPKENWRWDNGIVTMGTANVDVQALLAQKNDVWTGFPVGTTIGHVHFVGDSLTKGDDFFGAVLNMDTTYVITDNAHFYSHNRYHHHHAYNTWLGNGVKMRQENEIGLVDWQVLVDEAYFNELTKRADRKLLDESTLLIDDPFGNKLIVEKL